MEMSATVRLGAVTNRSNTLGKAKTGRVAQADRATAMKQQVASLKRQHILETAAELFFEEGYAAATVESLARAMGVTKPFIYTYFQNKGEILTEVCESGINGSLEALAKGQTDGDRAIDKLRIAMHEGALSVIRFQKYVVVYQRELKSLEPRDARRILQKRVQFDRAVAEILAAGVREGDMDVKDPGVSSVWIGGLLSWIPVWYNPEGRLSPEEVAAEFVRAIDRVVGAKPS